MSGTVARSLGALGDALGGTANVNFDSNTLFIDGTNNRVGIGTASPGYPLTVVGGGGVQISPGTSAQEGLRIQRAAGICSLSGINNDNNAFNALAFFTGASEAMRIDANGRVTMPFQPAFHAWGSNSVSVSITGYILALNNVVTNRGSHYNTSTFRFTAPVTGMYMLAHRVLWGGTGTGVSVYQAVNGGGSASPTEVFGYSTTTGYHTSSTGISVIQLNANDFVDLRTIIYNSSAQTLDLTRCAFSGYLVG